MFSHMLIFRYDLISIKPTKIWEKSIPLLGLKNNHVWMVNTLLKMFPHYEMQKWNRNKMYAYGKSLESTE